MPIRPCWNSNRARSVEPRFCASPDAEDSVAVIGGRMPYDQVLAERILAKMKGMSGLTEKKMFGGVGYMLHGNMACGVIKQDMIVRLSETDFSAALKKAHVRVFDMTGRP